MSLKISGNIKLKNITGGISSGEKEQHIDSNSLCTYRRWYSREKNKFWEEIILVIQNIIESCVIAGDFNNRVGSKDESASTEKGW